MAPGPLLIGLPAGDPDAALLCHPWVGGVVLFSRNAGTPKEMRDLTVAIRAARPGPLLVTVDHEGGPVQRLRQGFTRLPPLASYGRLALSDRRAARRAAYAHGRVTAGELLAVGIDLAFAPVLDLERGSRVIGERALAADPALVAELGAALIAGLRAGGMAAVGKHFPGHGTVIEDSHHQGVEDPRPFAQMAAADLLPFRALARQLPGIMMAHVVYPEVDPQPAGFSAAWIGRVLRTAWGYRGVVISDDLGMAGAAGAGDLSARLDAALAAGCDLALVCDPDASAALLAALEGRPAPAARAAVTALKARSPRRFGRSLRHWQRRLAALAGP